MKKVISLFLALTLLFQGSGFLGVGVAEAAKTYTKQTCTQTYGRKVCKKVNYMKMTANFSKSEVKQIIKQYKKYGKPTNQIVRYVVGTFVPPAGFAALAVDLGYSRWIGYFETAAKKGKGIQVKYDYILNPNSYSLNSVENMKITYK